MHLDLSMFGLHSSLKHRVKPTSAIIVELEAGARGLSLEFSGCMKNAVCPLLCKAEKRGCPCLQSPPHHPYLCNICIIAFDFYFELKISDTMVLKDAMHQGCLMNGYFFLGQKKQISVITIKEGQTCYSFFKKNYGPECKYVCHLHEDGWRPEEDTRFLGTGVTLT